MVRKLDLPWFLHHEDDHVGESVQQSRVELTDNGITAFRSGFGRPLEPIFAGHPLLLEKVSSSRAVFSYS